MFVEKRKISRVAKNILKKRYFSDGETNWEDIVNRVINNVVPKWNKKDKQNMLDLINNTYFVPNSPCLVNAGKRSGGLCACFVLDFPDTIEGIFKTKLGFALIARKGGGCGTSLTKIRPEGSSVAGSTHGYAGGPLKFANTISHDANAMTQSGFRAMAIMFTESIYHPDIIKFITSKTTEGMISNANMSVVVDDKFMEAVKNNEKFWAEFNGEKYKQYDARTIFDLIIEGMWHNGEPGLLFQDRINNSPYSYTGQEILGTNPCLHKDVILDDGDSLNPINNLNSIKSWKTGIKNCIKLTTNAGHEIIVTPDHNIMLKNGDFIRASESLNKEIAWGLGDKKSKIQEDFQLMGFLFGDGFLAGGKHGVSVKLNKKNEEDIFNKLTKYGFKEESCGSLYINKNKLQSKLDFNLDFMGESSLNKKIPESIFFSNYNILGSFISGLFEANGSVTKSNGQISFKSISKELIQQLQIALGYFGIESWIVTNKKQLISWNNGDYMSRRSYNLQIAPRNAHKFKERIGFISDRKNNRIKEFEKKYVGKLKVTNIEIIKDPQEVWDFKVDKEYGYANGIVAHNCSEQPLPANGVCNLGSLDLSKFLDDNNNLETEKLEVAVRLGIRFLDEVINATNFPLEDIEKWAKENRAVGLGIMGFADYCLMKKMAYGSDESLNELEFILSFIYKIAEEESVEQGEKLGVPKMCTMLPKPRRNITLLTVAPTGTCSLIAGCSSGIEPIFSEITIRNDKTGTYTFENNLASQPYFRCAVSSNGSQEVTWEEHVKVLASAQKYIDSGVSKTINFPTKTRRETIGKAAMMAWEMGCKGVAMYRNGSRKNEVLSPKNIKRDLCPICGNEMIIIEEKLKCTQCTGEDIYEKATGSYD